MKKDVQKQIEDLLKKHDSPEDCVFYKVGQGICCKAADVGLESFVLCLKPDSFRCKFSLFFGGASFCTCSIRIKIAKELGV